MSEIPPVIAECICPHCGARSQSNEGKCWLCFGDKSSSDNPYLSTSVPAESPPQPASRWDVVFGVLLGGCFVLTLLVGIGMGMQDRGMLIPFAIFVGPAYLVTIIRGLADASSGKGPKPTSLFLTFVLSLLATTAVLIILGVAAVVILFIICLSSVR